MSGNERRSQEKTLLARQAEGRANDKRQLLSFMSGLFPSGRTFTSRLAWQWRPINISETR
jgi:hypothetical protein